MRKKATEAKERDRLLTVCGVNEETEIASGDYIDFGELEAEVYGVVGSYGGVEKR